MQHPFTKNKINANNSQKIIITSLILLLLPAISYAAVQLAKPIKTESSTLIKTHLLTGLDGASSPALTKQTVANNTLNLNKKLESKPVTLVAPIGALADTNKNLKLTNTATMLKPNDITTIISFQNRTLNFRITNAFNKDVQINSIDQYTDKNLVCASSNTKYILNQNKSIVIFPFSIVDLNTCYQNYKIAGKLVGSYAQVIGLYDSQNMFKTNDYLADWSLYLIEPVVFKINYQVGNINTMQSYTKYFVYKIND